MVTLVPVVKLGVVVLRSNNQNVNCGVRGFDRQYCHRDCPRDSNGSDAGRIVAVLILKEIGQTQPNGRQIRSLKQISRGSGATGDRVRV
jgi:hypothetical protein